MKNLLIIGSIILLSYNTQKETQLPHGLVYLEVPAETTSVKTRHSSVICHNINDGINQPTFWNKGNGFNCALFFLNAENAQRVQLVYQHYRIHVTSDVSCFSGAKLKQRIIVTPTSSWYTG